MSSSSFRSSGATFALAVWLHVAGVVLMLPTAVADGWPPLGVPLLVLAQVAIAGALLRLYRSAAEAAPGFAATAAAFALLAGLAALALFAWFSSLAVGEVIGRPLEIPEEAVFLGFRPMNLVFLPMYLGFSVSFLLFGAALWRAGPRLRAVAALLLTGGLLWLGSTLLVEVSYFAFGVARPPGWVTGGAYLLLVGVFIALASRLRSSAGASNRRGSGGVERSAAAR